MSLQTCLQFEYTNYKGQDHTYLIVPEVNLTYEPHGYEGPIRWHLHGQVIHRDGRPRGDNPVTHRRSFILANIRNLQEVADPR